MGTKAARAVLRATLVLLSVSTFALAKDSEIPSGWRAADVLVDGVADDWAGRLAPLGPLPIFVGVQNDASFLYVCLKTADEATKKQILAVGLSVWLAASGKQDHIFGVRFPVGRLDAEQPDVPDTGDVKLTRALSLSVAGAELEILGQKEADLGRMRVSEARPIEAALGEQDGVLALELKVPLAFSVESPHAIETRPGRTIALGVETAEPKARRARSEDPGGGLGSGGRTGRSGSGGGFSGGRGGGRGERRSKGERDVARSYGKPLKAWVTVLLAAGPGA